MMFCCGKSSLLLYLYLTLSPIFSHLPLPPPSVSPLFSSSSSCPPWQRVIKHEHQLNSLTLSLSPILSSLFSPFPSAAFLSTCTPSLPLFCFPPSSALWTWSLLIKLSSVCVIMKQKIIKIQNIKTNAPYRRWCSRFICRYMTQDCIMKLQL